MRQTFHRVVGNWRKCALHDALKQRFLGGEVEIDQPFGDPGSPRDLVHLGRREAFFYEHRQCCIEHFVRPGLGATAEFFGVFAHGTSPAIAY